MFVNCVIFLIATFHCRALLSWLFAFFSICFHSLIERFRDTVLEEFVFDTLYSSVRKKKIPLLKEVSLKREFQYSMGVGLPGQCSSFFAFHLWWPWFEFCQGYYLDQVSSPYPTLWVFPRNILWGFPPTSYRISRSCLFPMDTSGNKSTQLLWLIPATCHIVDI